MTSKTNKNSTTDMDDQLAEVYLQTNAELLAALVLPSLGRAQTDDLIYELFTQNPEPANGVLIRTKNNELLNQMLQQSYYPSTSSSSAPSNTSSSKGNDDEGFYLPVAPGIVTREVVDLEELNRRKREYRLSAVHRYQEKKKSRHIHRPEKSEKKRIVASTKIRVKGRFVKSGDSFISINKVMSSKQQQQYTTQPSSREKSEEEMEAEMLEAALVLPMLGRETTMELFNDLCSSRGEPDAAPPSHSTEFNHVGEWSSCGGNPNGIAQCTGHGKCSPHCKNCGANTHWTCCGSAESYSKHCLRGISVQNANDNVRLLAAQSTIATYCNLITGVLLPSSS